MEIMYNLFISLKTFFFDCNPINFKIVVIRDSNDSRDN